MGTAKLDLFSIVLVGRQNPQILNHDFLIRNNVLPTCEPFVRTNLKEGETAFSDFISAPPFARIVYGNVSLLVHEDRYQALDESGSDPLHSPVMGITRKYFGDLLKFTPFKIGGMNLNYRLTFKEGNEEQSFDTALGLDSENARNAFGSQSLVTSMTAELPFLDGQMSVVIAKSRQPGQPARINFNYEFGFPGDMQGFLANLDRIGKIAEYRTSLFQRLGIQE